MIIGMFVKKKCLIVIASALFISVLFTAVYFFFLRNRLYDIVYKGNISCLDDILPPNQLAKLSPGELRILRNTIYAKYGYTFSSADLISHFSRFNWYDPADKNVESDMSEIDIMNIMLIEYYENSSKIKNKVTETRRTAKASNQEENVMMPKFDAEVTISANFYTTKISRLFLEVDQLPFKLARDIITDSGIIHKNVRGIFTGINMASGNFEYILIIENNNNSFSVENNFKNFGLKKDTYNDEIFVINYHNQQLYVCSAGQRIFIAKNKNLVYEAANENMIRQQIKPIGDIDIKVSENLLDMFSQFRSIIPYPDLQYMDINLTEDENYSIASMLVCKNKNTAQSFYDILSGLKQTASGISNLDANSRLYGLQGSLLGLVYTGLSNANITLSGEKLKISSVIHRDALSNLIPGIW
jgi:hypothetical protein